MPVRLSDTAASSTQHWHVQQVAWQVISMLMAGIPSCRRNQRWSQHILYIASAQVMQSYLPGPSTYQLSGGTGIKCRAARERGQDIISLKVGAAVRCSVSIWLAVSLAGCARCQPSSSCALSAYHNTVMAFRVHCTAELAGCLLCV